jgi:hypothetical protein
VDQQPLLEYLIATGPTVIFRQTADGVVSYVSPNIERILGYSPEEVVGVPGFWAARVHPDERDSFVAEEQTFARGETEVERDYRFLRKDGTYSWLHARTHVEYKDSGAVDAFLGYAIDMTDRRSVEQQNAQLFAFPLALIFVAGLDGHFKRVSAGYQRLLGWTEEELLSRPFFEFVHPDDLGMLGASIQGVAEGPTEVVNQEIRARCKDGTYRWLMGSYRPVLDEGLIYGMAVDITERKRTEEALHAAREEAERANRAKSEFLSRMSHELRTPLNAILGFGQLLEMDGLEPRHRDSVQQILKGGRHLLDLINEILDIARIESGKITLSLEPIVLADALWEAIDLIQPLAAEQGIELKAEDSWPPARHVKADRQRLKQVLLNLLSNAVKYNRPGGRVTIRCPDLIGDGLRVEVTDQGAGIPPEMIDRLFVPFERLGAEATGVEGTGLGLALSKGLMEAMGGSLWVKSVPSHGSTFFIELPLSEAPWTTGEEREDGERVATQSSLSSHTLLYIEDNLANLKLIERALDHRPGLILLTAMQGSLGLDIARQHRPDLILLDLHLPDMPGEQLLRHLHADPKTQGIPVIVISADATPGQVQKLLAAGARGYLTKPIDMSRFFQVVDEALAERGLARG